MNELCMLTPKDAAMLVALEDKMQDEWSRAVVTWARSQVSRRIALRCAAYEERSLMILIEEVRS
jgi:hypothetical protein